MEKRWGVRNFQGLVWGFVFAGLIWGVIAALAWTGTR